MYNHQPHSNYVAPSAPDEINPEVDFWQQYYGYQQNYQLPTSTDYQTHFGYLPQAGSAPPMDYQQQQAYRPPSVISPATSTPALLPPPPSLQAQSQSQSQIDPTFETKKYGWCEDSQRNRPQSDSLAAATIIFTASGLGWIQDVAFGPFQYYFFTNLRLSWFIAVIIGALISAVLMQLVSKRFFYFIASILVIANGILYISVSKNVTAIIIGRYCGGIAFGMSLNYFTLNGNQVQGIIVLVCGVLAFVINLCLTIESPMFYLRKDREPDAVKALLRLQRPHTVTIETYALLHENEQLLVEDRSRGYIENIAGGLLPMVKLCLFRGFISLSFSLPIMWGFMVAADVQNNLWSRYVYGPMRLLGVMIACWTLDTIGRKAISGITLLIGGGLLIGVAVMYSSYQNTGAVNEMNNVVIFLVIFQALIGIAAPASTCYLGEAFSVCVKPYFIMIVVVFENVLQIIVYVYFEETLTMMSDYAYVVGICQAVFAILFFVMMPETKKTTMRDALAKFKKVLHVR